MTSICSGQLSSWKTSSILERSVMQFQLGTSGLLQQLMRLLVRIPKMLWEPAFRCRPPSNEGTLGRSSITRSVLRASHARMHLPPPHFLPQPHEKLQVFETRINLTLGIAKNILSEIKHYFFFLECLKYWFVTLTPNWAESISGFQRPAHRFNKPSHRERMDPIDY